MSSCCDADRYCCPICWEKYKEPKSLPCGHSLCAKCIDKMKNLHNKLVCPKCRAMIYVPAEGLATNFDLQQVIEELPDFFDEAVGLNAKDRAIQMLTNLQITACALGDKLKCIESWTGKLSYSIQSSQFDKKILVKLAYHIECLSTSFCKATSDIDATQKTVSLFTHSKPRPQRTLSEPSKPQSPTSPTVSLPPSSSETVQVLKNIFSSKRRSLSLSSPPTPSTQVLLIGGEGRGSSLEYYNPTLPQTPLSYEPTPFIARKHHVGALIGDQVIITGGRLDDDKKPRHLASMEIFYLDCKQWYEGPPMSRGRSAACCSVANDKLFVFGCDETAEVFDIERFIWTQIASMPEPVSGASSVSLGEHIFVIGGGDAAKTHATATTTVRQYSLQPNSWCLGPNMKQQRKGLSAAVLDRCIIAGGGEDSREKILSSIERWDTRCARWHRIGSMNKKRNGHVLLNCDGKLIAFGGGNVMTAATVESYDARADKWTEIAHLHNKRKWSVGVVLDAQ